MLQSLHIRDLALVEYAELRFDEGLNVLSGVTGGGKSLVVQALHLLRGERASAGLVRRGADELRVDGEFLLGDGERSRTVAKLVHELFGCEPEEGTLLVTRIVDSRGRSRVRVGGRPGTLAALRELGAWLLEIHGQGESRALMRPEIQSEILDAFAGCQDAREDFAAGLATARGAAARLEEAAGDTSQRLSRAEFLRYQLTEMEELDLREGEVAELEAEHRVLAHQDQLRTLLEGALEALQEGEGSATDDLGRGISALRDASDIDHSLVDTVEGLQDAQDVLADSCRQLQSQLASHSHDPGRLEVVEERLSAVRRALSRLGPDEADYLSARAEMADELNQLEHVLEDPATLRAELDSRIDAAQKLGRRLLRARRQAAPRFTKAVEEELADLGMAETRIKVALEGGVERDGLLARATSHGPTPVDILVQINPGEPETSLRKTASGGELARIVLALKKCLADADRVPFVAFDEIDSEIGGRLGLAVGHKLRAVASSHQVLIVTHLPQVAAFADAHFQVGKEVSEGRTRTTVSRLESADAVEELAAMAVGEGVDHDALAEARKLMSRARAHG